MSPDPQHWLTRRAVPHSCAFRSVALARPHPCAASPLLPRTQALAALPVSVAVEVFRAANAVVSVPLYQLLVGLPKPLHASAVLACFDQGRLDLGSRLTMRGPPATAGSDTQRMRVELAAIGLLALAACLSTLNAPVRHLVCDRPPGGPSHVFSSPDVGLVQGGDSVRSVAAAIARMPMLSRLDLAGVLHARGAAGLAAAERVLAPLTQLASLTCLSLRHCNLPPCLEPVVHVLAGLSNLRTLDLASCCLGLATRVDLAALGAALPTSLAALVLASNELRGHALDVLAAPGALPRLSALASLDLADQRLHAKTESIMPLVSVLTALSGLTQLSLAGTLPRTVSGGGQIVNDRMVSEMQAMVSAVACMRGLRVLNMSRVEFFAASSAIIGPLRQALTQLPDLEDFDASQTLLFETGARAMLCALALCPRLKRLELGESMANERWPDSAPILSTMTGLTTLGLASRPGDRVAFTGAALGVALSSLRALRSLDLSGRILDHDAARAVGNALASCCPALGALTVMFAPDADEHALSRLASASALMSLGLALHGIRGPQEGIPERAFQRARWLLAAPALRTLDLKPLSSGREAGWLVAALAHVCAPDGVTFVVLPAKLERLAAALTQPKRSSDDATRVAARSTFSRGTTPSRIAPYTTLE